MKVLATYSNWLLIVIASAMFFSACAHNVPDLVVAKSTQTIQKQFKEAASKASWWTALTGYYSITKERQPELHAMVEESSKTLGLQMPALGSYVYRGNIFMRMVDRLVGDPFKTNAFAVGGNIKNTTPGVIVVGEDLLAGLEKEQLKGVVGHELGHLKKNHWIKGIAVFSAISMLGAFLLSAYRLKSICLDDYCMYTGQTVGDIRQFIFDGNKASYLPWLAIMAVSAAATSWYSRKHEKEADVEGAKCINDPTALGTGLEKLSIIDAHKSTWKASVMELFASHPRTINRKIALQAIKDARETTVAAGYDKAAAPAA